jgi:parallel beta-helix repeat protein
MMVVAMKLQSLLQSLTVLCLLVPTLSINLVPTNASTLQPHQPILINGNTEFVPSNGVVQGSGTLQDPYVISGWDINSSAANGIEVGNTSAVFVIRNVSIHSRTSSYYGVRLDHTDHATLANSTVQGNSEGVLATYSNNTIIDGNDASSNNAAGIDFGEVSFNASITRNLASGETDGITFSASYNITVANNVAENDKWGITDGSCLYGCSSGVIKNNQLSMDSTAVYVAYARALVENNTITNSIQGANLYSGIGVDVYMASATILDNLFINNSMAIEFDFESSGSTVVGNDISGGFIGIYSDQNSCCSNITRNVFRTTEEGGIVFDSGHGASGYRVYENAFVGAGTLAYDNAGGNYPNYWNASYPTGGNYWVSYTGVDNCSGPNQNICPSPDGIGDTPFTLAGGARDMLPLMKPPVSVPPAWAAGSALKILAKGTNFVTLSWPSPSDYTPVVAYRIYENGTLLASLSGSINGYTATGLNQNSEYSFKVVAIDAAQHQSISGLAINVRTDQASNSPKPPASNPPNRAGSFRSPTSLYWYVIPAVAAVALTPLLYYMIRSERKKRPRT